MSTATDTARAAPARRSFPSAAPVRWRERSRLVRLLRLWRTRNPVTFRDKVRYKMLRDHRALVVTFADKAAVRDHVAARIGAHYLPRVHAITGDPAALRHLDLPEEYVLKPTHGSGTAVVVSNSAPADARLPTDGSWVYRHVRPEHAARTDLARMAADWVAQLYGQGPNREWVYGEVPRQVIVEEFLHGPAGTVPDDYKFFVFSGRCRFVQVDSGRFGRRTQDFFDRDWTHLALSGGPPWADPVPPPPPHLEEMISVAERLGAETDFVRVDLYDVEGRVVFGELTSFPAGGDSPFDPESFNAEFGRAWTVPRRYR
ncbi:ATP-grasp fold amidoligase family protein [Microbacterium sp. 179-B 1A2 NHS]|uniref:ATP-grasp fold amidoligase family protein n=1 Tax=Microbacterium sp. 179-B 1A2 NHS TaxID=3142383 RepID=UPI0039A10078